MTTFIICDTFGTTAATCYNRADFDEAIDKLQRAGLRVSVGHTSARVLGVGALVVTKVLRK